MLSKKCRQTAAAVVCVLVFELCSGCSSAPRHVQMYDGPERREAQAIAKVDPTAPQGRLRILAVDGNPTSTTGGVVMNNGNWPVSVGVLPGEHTLRCESVVGTASVVADLRWLARAGETYLIKSEARGYYAQIWILDARTSLKVSY